MKRTLEPITYMVIGSLKADIFINRKKVMTDSGRESPD